ncbi:CsgBAC operon transcriptional regulatory protein [Vibrio thalassae]|uniref:CsgBAC operon transcriptional regulatory protein n=1 Tax=Vibrio thalassae TaxID=1243014 RepID=A0A240EKL6_9VIBR|nr:LuxR C-terminal-related transcriptional regulator [Vibrio thalassae]SNX48535.1 CsgBAC operon transcriptional regulatory protein [Vibrio thalassae]
MATSVEGNQRAVLLAENNLQSSLLIESIEQQLNIEIRLISPERIGQLRRTTNDNRVDLIIINYPTMGHWTVRQYHEVRDVFPIEAQEVLINTSPGIRQSEMLRWQRLVGVFYATDNLERLITGFKCILNGEMWMSRKLVYEYIKLYLGKHSRTPNPYYTQLTRQEQEIIKLLGHGASNTQIAQTLFVSENTVKAHLHNALKKIKVNNRLQARIWAKGNITPRELA